MSKQGFAAREPDFLDSESYKELNEAEVVANRQLGILCSELAGPAVDALIVAAVSDGDTEVVNDAAMAIGQPLGGRHRGGSNWGSGSHRHPFRLYRFHLLCRSEGTQSPFGISNAVRMLRQTASRYAGYRSEERVPKCRKPQ